MKIRYDKLWKKLEKKGIKQSDFRKAIDIAPNTYTRVRKNEEVSMSVLLKMCEYLKCDIGDVCEFVEDEEGVLK